MSSGISGVGRLTRGAQRSEPLMRDGQGVVRGEEKPFEEFLDEGGGKLKKVGPVTAVVAGPRLVTLRDEDPSTSYVGNGKRPKPA